MTREQIIGVLKNARDINSTNIDDINRMQGCTCTEEGIAQLQKNGLPQLKGLWLLPNLKAEERPSIIIETDADGFDETRLTAEINRYLPHDMAFKLSRDVLEDEPSMYEGADGSVLDELAKGNVRKVYVGEGSAAK